MSDKNTPGDLKHAKKEFINKFSDLRIPVEKYTEDELHSIKNCLVFVAKWCDNVDHIKMVDRYLTELVRLKENNIPFNVYELERKFGISG